MGVLTGVLFPPSPDPREAEGLEKGLPHASAGLSGISTGPRAHETCARSGIIPRTTALLVLFFSYPVGLTQYLVWIYNRVTHSHVADTVARARVTQVEQAAHVGVSAQFPINVRATQPARHPSPDITVPRPQWEPARIRGGRVLCCCGKGADVTIEAPREGPGLPHPPNIPAERSAPAEFIVGAPPASIPRPERAMSGRSRASSSATAREPERRSRVQSHATLPARSRANSQGGEATRSRAGSHASRSRSRRPSQAATTPQVPPLPTSGSQPQC